MMYKVLLKWFKMSTKGEGETNDIRNVVAASQTVCMFIIPSSETVETTRC